MNIQVGKKYRNKTKGLSMEPIVTPEYLSHTGVLCTINTPKCWNLNLKERFITYKDFSDKYKLAETPWQKGEFYDDFNR